MYDASGDSGEPGLSYGADGAVEPGFWRSDAQNWVTNRPHPPVYSLGRILTCNCVSTISEKSAFTDSDRRARIWHRLAPDGQGLGRDMLIMTSLSHVGAQT